ncbi:MAG TPA: hypothetical protein VH302_03075 [Bryobacteraceae bacterium]|nr:hypothetical protein [Bryobacteraceae bacterium]
MPKVVLKMPFCRLEPIQRVKQLHSDLLQDGLICCELVDLANREANALDRDARLVSEFKRGRGLACP